MARVQLTINGTAKTIDADPEMPLLWVLRDLLGMTGTKYGCGAGLCGSCTILEGDSPVRACQVPLSAAAGNSYTTIEGLSKDGLHPIQKAWLEEQVSQCGYCQPGMILEVRALLKSKPSPTNAEIDGALADHVCRCGSYPRIRKAARLAARLGGGR
ncbi:MAG: (2Fe-2S)-binding protein [Acidobacteria bacterium]|nr:(2Fe-2S)-binding protein [Acidobacteriota bacterium]